jgi:colicin import membrane protein
VKFVVLPDGSVLDGSIRVVQSSGQSAYDDAVQRAIIASQPLPLPDDLALRRQMRDVLLKTTNR